MFFLAFCVVSLLDGSMGGVLSLFLSSMAFTTSFYWVLRIAYKFCKYLNFKFIERIDFYLEFYRYFLRAEQRKCEKSRKLWNEKPLTTDDIRKGDQIITFLIVLAIVLFLSLVLFHLITGHGLQGFLCDYFGSTIGRILSNKIKQIYRCFVTR